MKLRRSLAFSVGLVFAIAMGFAGPAISSEREIEQDLPAGSPREIKSPIQRIFPSIARGTPLFPRLAQRLEGLPPFLADTEVGLRYATFYKRGDEARGGLNEAWVMGGSLYYQSGWLAELLQIELEGFTSQPIVAQEDRGGTFLLEPRQNGYVVLGIANARLQHAGYRLTGYRQYLDLPYLNRRFSRLTPNTFESITLEKFEGPLRFSAGHTFRIKQRNSDEFVSMARAAGVPRDTGLWHGGILWAPNDDVQVGGVVGHLQDLFTGLYSETNLSRSISKEVEVRLDLQFAYQWEDGDDLLAGELNDTWNLGVRGSVGYGGAVLRLAYAMTGSNGSMQGIYGSSPSYVDLQIRGFNRADEKVFLASLSYDFGRVGASGLKAIINFAAGFDGELDTMQGDQHELDLLTDYRLGSGLFENLWLRFRAAWVHDGLLGRDGTDVQLILRYEFPVL